MASCIVAFILQMIVLWYGNSIGPYRMHAGKTEPVVCTQILHVDVCILGSYSAQEY